jgi:hypothetical protein
MATRVGGGFSSLPLGKRQLARPEITQNSSLQAICIANICNTTDFTFNAYSTFRNYDNLCNGYL